jgi:hypothetical protein
LGGTSSLLDFHQSLSHLCLIFHLISLSFDRAEALILVQALVIHKLINGPLMIVLTLHAIDILFQLTFGAHLGQVVYRLALLLPYRLQFTAAQLAILIQANSIFAHFCNRIVGTVTLDAELLFWYDAVGVLMLHDIYRH